MERLWENAERSAAVVKQQRPISQVALDYSVCSGRSVIVSSNGHQHQQQQQQHDPTSNGRQQQQDGSNRMEEEEDDTPMICMICEDKATGLHYGIITCEGYEYTVT